MIAPATEGKVIPRSYSSVSHLPGSKMIDREDKLLGSQQVSWLTKRRRTPKDLVIVTEKIDGMNCSVYKQDGMLFPLIKKGYDCRCNPYHWINDFSNYVEEREDRFMDLLDEGERICGEWMIKTHTLSYRLPHEPFVAFDLIKDSVRAPYLRFRDRVFNKGFITAGVVHIGESMPTDMAVNLLGSGYHGVIGEPEGVIYRYEDAKSNFICIAKFVSNPLLGNDELFHANDPLFNKWKGYTYVNE